MNKEKSKVLWLSIALAFFLVLIVVEINAGTIKGGTVSVNQANPGQSNTQSPDSNGNPDTGSNPTITSSPNPTVTPGSSFTPRPKPVKGNLTVQNPGWHGTPFIDGALQIQLDLPAEKKTLECVTSVNPDKASCNIVAKKVGVILTKILKEQESKLAIEEIQAVLTWGLYNNGVVEVDGKTYSRLPGVQLLPKDGRITMPETKETMLLSGFTIYLYENKSNGGDYCISRTLWDGTTYRASTKDPYTRLGSPCTDTL